MPGHQDLSEEDTKRLFITPAITAAWAPDKIMMEAKITDGQVWLRGKMSGRKKPRSADYLLSITPNNPIAVVEAKRYKFDDAEGIQQAIAYADMLDLPFAYSSSGKGFREHDMITGSESNIPLNSFPTPENLYARMVEEKKLTPQQQAVISVPYYSSRKTFAPRYYQRIAVNRTVNAIAGGQKRILLVMATGTGKTYTAFQIVYRMLKSNLGSKILYLADRNVLVDQSIQQDFSPLTKIIHKVEFAKDDPATVTAYQIYFSLYQQLAAENKDSSEDLTAQKLGKLFKPDFFDVIIVDECHRGSAREASNWRRILNYFSSAVQIGMTATPKETDDVSNIDYFGEPLYTYSLKQGIMDGFLAPFRVVNVTTNISEGWRPEKGEKDIDGNEVPDRIYTNSDYDTTIVIPRRTATVAEEITKFLRSTNPMDKTIVFCPTENAALRMRNELTRLNSDLVAKYPDYVVRITSSDTEGRSKLKQFISVSSPTPVIATTSQLLSTGADCKMVKLIVLDEMIGSMTEFKQIIGRGTRLRESEGKMFFTIMDFRNVTRLFADPDWDGPIIQDPGWPPSGGSGGEGGGGGGGEPQPPIILQDGTQVNIINRKVSVYDASGKLLSVEELTDYTRETVRGYFPSLRDFISRWTDEAKRTAITGLLKEKNLDLEQLKEACNMADTDDFDFICHIAYDKKPLTRKERANNVKKRDFLSKYSDAAREVIEKLLDRYSEYGIDDIKDPRVLNLEPFLEMGGQKKIAQIFGGKEGWKELLSGLEKSIYTDEAS